MADFTPHSRQDRSQMLADLGLVEIEDLFADIPEQVRLSRPLALPEGRSEAEVLESMDGLARLNRAAQLCCFAGGGAYDHFVPAAVRSLIGRSEWMTSYTPYQPELAQGVLQALFEFQSLVVNLTGLEVANSSLYDGPTALAEALSMVEAEKSTPQRVSLISAGVPESYVQLATTLGQGLGRQLVSVQLQGGLTDWGAINEAPDRGQVAAVVVAQVNRLGAVEDIAAARQLADRLSARLIVIFDPLTAGLLPRVGDLGADVAVGDGQALAFPLSFGGPGLGLFACRREHIRRLPGRVVGYTVDEAGRDAYVMTLRAREQDIRRERATSNICTNQTLMAIGATISLSWWGRSGMAARAVRVAEATAYLMSRLRRIPGVEIAGAEAPHWREVAITVPGATDDVIAGLADEGFLVGPAQADGYLSLAVTEKRNRAQIDGLVAALADVLQVIPEPEETTAGVGPDAAGVGPDAAGVGPDAAGVGTTRLGPAQPGGMAGSLPLVGGAREPLIFEFSRPGRRAWSLPEWRIPEPSDAWWRDEGWAAKTWPDLPEVSERDLVAHFSRLSHRQYSVDAGAYPLGSCTMKYNPKLADEVAGLPGLTGCHPGSPAELVPGWLRLLADLEAYLCEITGMAAASFQPPAGAAGELTGLLMIRAYHASRGDPDRRVVVIPDSAHGTNPASVTMAGLDVSTVSSNASGRVDLRELARILDAGPVAGIMLTNPNTLGLFEREIGEIAQMVHDNGGLLYYDGANLNPILGVVRPGDMGFDVIHLNLHKTFATPHGGGGPGAGPVLVGERLADFRPGPVVGQGDSGGLEWQIPARSIGRVHSWHGNALVLARAFAYMVALGGPGLRRVAEAAVLNANWLLNRLAGSGQFAVPYPGRCLHELVVAPLGRAGLSPAAHATKVAKALIGYGFHPPTINFPLVVPGALMIEPTETESPETLAALAEALCAAATDAEGIPPQLLTPVASLDEALAARRPRLSFTDLVASKADA